MKESMLMMKSVRWLFSVQCMGYQFLLFGSPSINRLQSVIRVVNLSSVYVIHVCSSHLPGCVDSEGLDCTVFYVPANTV